MDDKLNEKAENLIDNLMTIAGASLLIFPIIKQATKSISPEIDRLLNGGNNDKIPLLESAKETQDKTENKNNDAPHDEATKSRMDELADLKRQLAEYKSKESQNSNGNTQDKQHEC